MNELFFLRLGVWGLVLLNVFRLPFWTLGIFMCFCGFVAICIRWKQKPDEREMTRVYGTFFCLLGLLMIYYA